MEEYLWTPQNDRIDEIPLCLRNVYWRIRREEATASAMNKICYQVVLMKISRKGNENASGDAWW